MKKSLLLLIITAVVMMGLPGVDFAQSPNLGTVNNVVLYTGGTITNSGSTFSSGNISGTYSGTKPVGSLPWTYNATPLTSYSNDLTNMYNYFKALTPYTTRTSTLIGSGNASSGSAEVPGSYFYSSTGTITTDKNLNFYTLLAPSTFLYYIKGNFTVSTTMALMGASSQCKIFWIVDGNLTVTNTCTQLYGTFIVKGTISVANTCAISGRLLSLNTTTSAVNVTSLTAGLPSCNSTWTGGYNSATVPIDQSTTAAVSTTDWTTGGNWDQNVPNGVGATTIAVVSGKIPVIATGAVATVNGLTINSGASLTVNPSATVSTLAGAGKLEISGTIAGTFTASNGTIEMNGTTAQTVPASTFVGNNINNLIISNNVSLGGQQNITGTLGFGRGSSTLTTGGTLTLISSATATAQVADITSAGTYSGNTITGSVNVQRYFPTRRAWHLLTAPTTGTNTIYSTWQTNGVSTAGTGMLISGASATNGIDLTPRGNSSLKTYTYPGPSLNIVTNTNVPLNSGIGGAVGTAVASTGYFAFVRGDRTTANYNVGTSTNTTLTSAGSLITGNQSFSIIAPSTGTAYALIANPYASPIDYATLKTNSTNLPTTFYTWDPSLNLVGGYVAASSTSTPAYTISGINRQYIQAGEAFYIPVTAGSNVTVNFTEQGKNITPMNNSNFRPLNPTNNLDLNSALSSSLYLLNTDSTTQLADANLTQFNNRFSDNIVADEDAVKFTNINESFGLSRHGSTLAIESRPNLSVTDTIFLKLWSTSQRSYRFQFEPTNLDNSNLMGYLQDKYLNTSKKISLTNATPIDFNVDGNAASSAADRFQIIFKTVFPFAFTCITATKNNSDIAVEWKVANETDIAQYSVEKSTDGTTFTKVNTNLVKGNNNATNKYIWLDANAQTGDNIYRVKMLGKDGSTKYTENVKVAIAAINTGISIYPNPITEGKINIQMGNQPSGTYHLSLTNNNGQVIFTGTVQNNSNKSSFLINLNTKPAKGIYNLQITAPQNKITTQKIIVD